MRDTSLGEGQCFREGKKVLKAQPEALSRLHSSTGLPEGCTYVTGLISLMVGICPVQSYSHTYRYVRTHIHTHTPVPVCPAAMAEEGWAVTFGSCRALDERRAGQKSTSQQTGGKRGCGRGGGRGKERGEEKGEGEGEGKKEERKRERGNTKRERMSDAQRGTEERTYLDEGQSDLRTVHLYSAARLRLMEYHDQGTHAVHSVHTHTHTHYGHCTATGAAYRPSLGLP